MCLCTEGKSGLETTESWNYRGWKSPLEVIWSNPWMLQEADGITKGTDKLMDMGITEFWRDQTGMGAVTSSEQQWLLGDQGTVDLQKMAQNSHCLCPWDSWMAGSLRLETPARIIKSKPNPSHCAHWSHLSVPHLHHSGTPPGMVTPHLHGQLCQWLAALYPTLPWDNLRPSPLILLLLPGSRGRPPPRSNVLSESYREQWGPLSLLFSIES